MTPTICLFASKQKELHHAKNVVSAEIDILMVAYCGRLSRPRDYLNRVYNIKSESRLGGGGGRKECSEDVLLSVLCSSAYRI